MIFAGNGKYQVYGPWMDQCVVNLIQKTCSCRSWELTGIPCKHAICAMFDKIDNREVCGEPEEWVDDCYKLNTWKEMYKYKVEPINGRNMCEKSQCPFTLTHPKHHTQVGRPKKKRKRAAGEEPSQGKNLSRNILTVTCTKCKNKGHNSRTCKGQGGTNEDPLRLPCFALAHIGGSYQPINPHLDPSLPHDQNLLPGFKSDQDVIILAGLPHLHISIFNLPSRRTERKWNTSVEENWVFSRF
ncbi:hypothetical protein LXL04_026404 [Taraxacum kok-saghyz]